MRIVAGSRRGARIFAPKGSETRPTSDRVREAAFNLIGPVDGASVLDLFAGSGAMGLEALSRGAASAVFVESDREACRDDRAQRREARAAGRARCSAATLSGRSRPRRRTYDLVLCDPPYGFADHGPARPLSAAGSGARRADRLRDRPPDRTGDRRPDGPHVTHVRLRTPYAVRACDHAPISPGNYDPVTNGHLDIIRRAAAIFDRVVVGVVRHPTHKETTFTIEERVEFLREALADVPNVEVDVFAELVVEFARRWEAKVIVKGLRVISDFEWEFQMNQLNRHLAPEIETVYVMASPQYSFISSSGVKEIATFGGNVDGLVPPAVAARFRELFPEGGRGPRPARKSRLGDIWTFSY